MVLAELLLKTKQPFSIAHCNFQLRDKESDLDEAFVRDWGSRNNIQVFVKKFDTLTIKAETGGSTQMLARSLRYNWFEELRNKHSFNYVATAHHLDDSIETFFINLSRGTGLAGLTGIAARKGDLIRPLLFASKDELLQYAQENRIEWREDASNETDNYLRNRIRHHITPQFVQENPSWKNSMFETLQHLGNSEELVNQHLEELRKNVEVAPGQFDSTLLKEIKPLAPLLHFCFHSSGFTPAQLETLENLLGSSEAKILLGKDCRLVVSRDKLVLQKLQKLQQAQEILVIKDMEDLNNIPGVVKTEVFESNSTTLSSIKAADPRFTFLDLELLDFPLKASNWTEGDRFTPLGMTGSKLVSDFFNDIKLDKIEKESQIILRSSKNDIIWIAGKRLDNHFKVSDSTRLVLKIEFSDNR